MLVLITYIEVCSGIVRASELNKVSHDAALSTVARKSTTASSAAINIRKKSNPHTFGEHSSSILDMKGPEGPKDPKTPPDDDAARPFSNSLILSKIKKGLSMSFIARLSKSRAWVPLGGISCVRKARHQALMLREDEDCPAFPPSEICIMSVFVDWKPSAEMLISNFYNVLPGLRPLPDVLLDWHQDEELSQSLKILISPSGLVASFCGLVSKSQESGDADFESSFRQSFNYIHISDSLLEQKKKPITNRLAEQSIKLSDDENWVLLQNINPTNAVSEQEAGDFKSLGTFLWPASLCFCITENLPRKEWGVEYGQDSLTDPLLDAENWFTRKGVRAEAIEANRKRKEAEAEKHNEEQNRARQDTFTEVLTRPTQYSSAQDVASIYPTPPDGLPSQNIVTANQRPTPASYGETVSTGQLDSIDAETHLVESPLAANLAPVISSTTYDQLEDDLYAAVGNDMFAANDLTEADLDFFDEPSADGNIILTGNDANLTGTFSENVEVPGFRADLGTLDDVVSEDDAELSVTDSITRPRQRIHEIGTVDFALLNFILTGIPR